MSRTYRLDPAAIQAAQQALGTRTATETIETALDLVLLRRELIEGARALRGVQIDPPSDLP